MNILKRAIPFLLAGALLLTTGCSGADLSWSYRSGDNELPIGVYIYYLVNAASSAETQLRELHAEDDEYTAPTKYKDLLGEALETQTIADYMPDEADRNIRRHLAVDQKFGEMGLELNDSQLQYAANSAASTWAGREEFFTKNGIAESSLQLVFENNIKERLIFVTLYGEDGERAISESELQATLEENYVYTDVMVFAKTFDDEGEEESRPKAEEYLKRAQDGEDLYDLIYEQEKQTALDSLEAGGEAVEVERPEEGTRTVMFSDDMRASYGDQLVDDAFSVAVGEYILSDDENYYYLLHRRDVLEDPDLLEMYRDDLLDMLKADEYDELVDQWAQGVTVEANTPALEKYGPAKLTMD